MTLVAGADPGPILRVRVPPGRPAERRYVLDVVLRERLGLDYVIERGGGRDVELRLVGDTSGVSVSVPDVLLGSNAACWLTEASLPVLPLARCTLPAAGASQSLPVLWGEPATDDRPWAAAPAGLRLRPDVFGGVFFLLTRYEEVVRRDRDRHDRFPSTASIAAREGFLDRAIADEYTDLLWAAMHAVWPRLERRTPRVRVRLTHDVDLPWAGLAPRALVGDVVRRRDPGLAVRRAIAMYELRRGRSGRDPFDTFDFLMATSERHGLRSTFYFRARGVGGDTAARYRLSDPLVTRVLRRIHQRGHEIGLHAGYASYRSPDQTRAELAELLVACRGAGIDQEHWGVRQHFLRLALPHTWRTHEAVGLRHDSSLGFADRPGFRAGTSLEFPVFDVEASRPLALRERPLIAMDATVFGYLDLGLDEAEAAMQSLAATCRRHGGDAALLYHNDSLWNQQRRRHYERVVDSFVGAD